MDFLTREVFDALIIGVIIIGSALAAVRLYADFTRPLPDNRPPWSVDDTQPHPPYTETNAHPTDTPHQHDATNKETDKK